MPETFQQGDLLLVGWCTSCEHNGISNPPGVITGNLPEPCHSCLRDPDSKTSWQQGADSVPYNFVVKNWLEGLERRLPL